jgi:hypothetical protein
MNSRVRFCILIVLVLIPVLVTWSQPRDGATEPFQFFREYVGLNDGEIRQIRSGKAVARILDSPAADEVFVFGSVYVNSKPDRYLKLASDIDALRKLPNYLAIQKFSNPPQLSDLEGFTLEDEDLKELRKCEPGRCEIQLPSEAMESFKQSVDWSSPGVADRVNHLAQEMALEALLKYIQGGNEALGVYRDKNHPAVVEETFQTLLRRSKALPLYMPVLDHYLLAYPNANSDNIESQFYWEKVNFGLKPTLRIVQAVVYRDKSSANPVYAIAIKQLYASHYFETALDLTVCVPDQERSGMYVITLKGSSQAGLTGLKGGIVRKVAVDKTRSSLEKALAAIKEKLEAQAD